MDATDPLCAISSTARLLPRTLGPAPAIGPSPLKARDALLEAIALARSLVRALALRSRHAPTARLELPARVLAVAWSGWHDKEVHLGSP
jgi:hypothetical protein